MNQKIISKKVLAIETSCDETGLAFLEKKEGKIKKVAEELASQTKLHQKHGGVFPTLAQREHQKNLPLLLRKIVKKTPSNLKLKSEFQIEKEKRDLKKSFKDKGFYRSSKKTLKEIKRLKIDRVAVTYGPGLEPCLWMGVNFAKIISAGWKVPLIPVNHIEAHILVNLLEKKEDGFRIRKKEEVFPALALVASGGHTLLALVKDIGKYKVLGETRDDAAGECFDKTARMMGLPYPGGPSIAEMAEKFSRRPTGSSIHLPRPMIKTKNYDFSFSGLKTAVLYLLRDTEKKRKESESFIQELSFEIEEAITDVLTTKLIKASLNYPARSVILGGGVCANKKLREKIKNNLSSTLQLLAPSPELCTDNAFMIAAASFFMKSKNWKEVKAHANLNLEP